MEVMNVGIDYAVLNDGLKTVRIEKEIDVFVYRHRCISVISSNANVYTIHNIIKLYNVSKKVLYICMWRCTIHFEQYFLIVSRSVSLYHFLNSMEASIIFIGFSIIVQ